MNTDIIKKMIDREFTVSTMESCTGGLLASTITDVSGASEIFSGGYVTYSNGAKVKIGVPEAVIDRYGVYSKETAETMARVCRNSYGTLIGIGITGTLGRKDPNNEGSVSGEAYYCIAIGNDPHSYKVKIDEHISDRKEMKKAIVSDILGRLDELLTGYQL